MMTTNRRSDLAEVSMIIEIIIQARRSRSFSTRRTHHEVTQIPHTLLFAFRSFSFPSCIRPGSKCAVHIITILHKDGHISPVMGTNIQY